MPALRDRGRHGGLCPGPHSHHEQKPPEKPLPRRAGPGVRVRIYPGNPDGGMTPVISKFLPIYLIPAMVLLGTRYLTATSLEWEILPSVSISLTLAVVFLLAGRRCYELSFRFEDFGWEFSPA